MSRDMIQKGYWEIVPGIKVRSREPKQASAASVPAGRRSLLASVVLTCVMAHPGEACCRSCAAQRGPCGTSLSPFRERGGSYRGSPRPLSHHNLPLPPPRILAQDSMEYRSLSEPDSASLWSPENIARLRKASGPRSSAFCWRRPAWCGARRATAVCSLVPAVWSFCEMECGSRGGLPLRAAPFPPVLLTLPPGAWGPTLVLLQTTEVQTRVVGHALAQRMKVGRPPSCFSYPKPISCR